MRMCVKEEEDDFLLLYACISCGIVLPGASVLFGQTLLFPNFTQGNKETRI
jgi:hypothetical protein